MNSVPQLAVVEVGRVVLPVLGRIVESGEQAPRCSSGEMCRKHLTTRVPPADSSASKRLIDPYRRVHVRRSAIRRTRTVTTSS